MSEASSASRDEAAIAERFLGSWRLVKVTRQDAETGEDLDKGVSYDGYIAYTPDRRVSVIITRRAPGEERNITCYGGKWTIEGDKVIHHVDIGTREGREGTRQPREFRFHEDRLTLTPPVSVDFVHKAPTRRSLEWRRVSAD